MLRWDEIEYAEWSSTDDSGKPVRNYGTRQVNASNTEGLGSGIVRRISEGQMREETLFENNKENGLTRKIFTNMKNETEVSLKLHRHANESLLAEITFDSLFNVLLLDDPN